MKLKKILSLLTATIMALSLAIPAAADISDYAPDIDAESNKEPLAYLDRSGEELVAENDTLALYYDSGNNVIAVLDKRNNHKWYSDYEGADLEKAGKRPNEYWLNNLRSVIQVYYVNKSSKTGTETSTNIYDSSAGGTVKGSKIKDGVRMDITLKNLYMKLAVEFTLDGDSLLVKIPFDSISETGNFILTAVAVLPFFGASTDKDDGYFVYPNGSGELYRFKDKSDRLFGLKEYSLDVYSSKDLDLVSRFSDDQYDISNPEIMLPVYGIKKGNAGLATVIEQGDANSSISIVPGGVAVELNRIYSVLRYRYSYDFEGSSLNIGGGNSTFPLATLFDSDPIEGDRVVRYTFLANEEANYSGAAKAIHDNFVERGLLKDKLQNANMPIYLDLFMGTTEKKLIFNFFIPMTTYSQAQDMLSYLTNNGVSGIVSNLNGWTKNGANSVSLNGGAARRLGGKKDLKELSAFAKENNITLTAGLNLVNIKENTTKYNASTDAAKDVNGFTYQSPSFVSIYSYKLFSPKLSVNKGKTLIDTLASFGIGGSKIDDIGNFIFNDYNSRYKAGRKETAEGWNELSNFSEETLGFSISDGGNAYILSGTNLLTDIPSEGGNILLGDESVPFYQMIVHGSALYTGTPINLFYDSKMQILKNIEYGYTPFYQLTNEAPSKIRNTQYNMLFTSKFDNWKDDVTELYKKLSADLNGTWNEQMVGHDCVQTNVYVTEYESGTKIYVNYNKTDVTVDGVEIKAQDYTVVKGGAK